LPPEKLFEFSLTPLALGLLNLDCQSGRNHARNNPPPKAEAQGWLDKRFRKSPTRLWQHARPPERMQRALEHALMPENS
jgi:hypothetical protein